ncbi:hypothetical protein PINS_up004282 [Pythium insidiosum]|nr:hypothetical protein PINS_up004282 [Pythium insidiosum]
MRKLNTTYGVPIAPLQRSIVADALPLKPKMMNATVNASGTTTFGATFSGPSKVSKISITPDISDFKLVQIFHNFCDPTAKILSLQRFQQLLQHHQVKDETSQQQATSTASSSANAAMATPSPEAQSLFKILDKKNLGYLDLETFMSSFQICNRCTEAKRRAHSAVCAAQGQSFVPSPLERQLMEDVAPVIVRVVPTQFEGHKVKSCEHYQWTWCEGFEKTGNEKCKGTNRHDKCPKYLANCTLWKHKLPPKNRKPKVFENVESPSKKFKHFA